MMVKCGSNKFVTAQLTPSELKKLRAKNFIERNKIIQDKLDSCTRRMNKNGC